MKRMLPWVLFVLLAASVGFNAFFAVGYQQAKHAADEAQTFEGRARLFAAKLNLDASQQKEFEKLLSQTMEKRKKSKLETWPEKETLFAEFEKATPDEKALQAYAEKDHGQTLRKDMMQMTSDLLKILRPDQKKIFIDAMREKAKAETK